MSELYNLTNVYEKRIARTERERRGSRYALQSISDISLPTPFPLRDLPIHAPLRSTQFSSHSAHMLCGA